MSGNWAWFCGARMVPCLVDAHCHVSTMVDAVGCDKIRSNLDLALAGTASDVQRCVMSTNVYDWELLEPLLLMKQLDDEGPGINVSLGVHPWYCHLYQLDRSLSKVGHYRNCLKCKDEVQLMELVEQLPDPVDLSSYLSDERVSRVGCIGEIGLDKVFRLPQNGFLVSNNGTSLERSSLSNVRVEFAHQIQVFETLLKVAKGRGLPVSIHSVKCQGTTFDICKRILLDSEVNICLHSFTGTLDTVRLWLANFPHERLFFSVSCWINLKDWDSGAELLKSLPLQCILTETDCSVDSVSSQEQRQMLDSVLDAISRAHGISRTKAMDTVLQNFNRFLRK